MKAYMKDSGGISNGGRAGLAVLLLCLPLWASAAQEVVRITGDKIETTVSAPSSVPEGYRPLSVTMFPVEVETRGIYDITVGVEYHGEAADAMNWINENIIGETRIYTDIDDHLIGYYLFFSENNKDEKSGIEYIYLNKKYYGETYHVNLDSGWHLISLRLFFKNDISEQKPDAFILFNRWHPEKISWRQWRWW